MSDFRQWWVDNMHSLPLHDTEALAKCAWQAARQSGEVEPVGYLHNRPERIPCFFETLDDARLSGCEVVPVYAHPQPNGGGGEYAAYLEGMNSHLKAENEALRERLENYEALKRMHRIDNYPNELSAKAWLLRKQAEAVEALMDREQFPGTRGWPNAVEEIVSYAQRLRQKADELERKDDNH